MTPFFHSPPALQLHDILRLANLLGAMFVLGNHLGILRFWRDYGRSQLARIAGDTIILVAIIIGSAEAVWLDTQATIRTPILSFGLLLIIYSIHVERRHHDALRD